MNRIHRNLSAVNKSPKQLNGTGTGEIITSIGNFELLMAYDLNTASNLRPNFFVGI